MNTLPDNQIISEPAEDESIDFRQITYKYFSNWPWFVLSMLIFLCLGFAYNKYATPMYNVTARVLVNDEKKGGGLSTGTDMLGGLGGLLGGKSSVDNEVEILKTRHLLERVVEDLKLNVTYFQKGPFKDIEIYRAPFLVEPIALSDTLTADPVKLTILENEKISLKAEDLDTVVNFNDTLNFSDIGRFRIVRNPNVRNVIGDYSFLVQSIDDKASSLMESLTVAVGSKLITIVDLSLESSIPEQGEDILNRLIYNYVQENLNDKNEVADSTIAFIRRRLLIISSELGSAEEHIQSFKQKNSLADMTEQGKLLVSSTGQYTDELARTETQVSIVNSLLEYLKDDTKNKRVLPSPLIPTNMVFSSAVEKYNMLLLERGRKLIGLSETNPIILNLDKEIDNSRSDIISNLTTTLDGLTITRDRLKSQMAGAEGQIKQVPETERNYLELARQQQIKQELYIFLMQKSEETAISKTANIANSKTIDLPRADNKPFAPQKSITYLGALFFGFILPFGYIFLKDLLNNKVESKEDISRITNVPIVGEISHNVQNDNLIIANDSRSVIAEQFRALRTNLSFFLKSDDEKVILMTSSMAGEGKSFVAINIGTILAMSGKKVLLIELDLRKPGLSKKLNIPNKLGFTNYVISNDVTTKDIIQPLGLHENLYLVGSGPIPPNPAETIMSGRSDELLKKLKEEFDYVIIDAPPIGLVADAQLLGAYADICLYLVRQNYTLKEQVNIVRNLSQSNKMSRLGIVVNDIKQKSGYGYGYGSYVYGEYGDDKRTASFWGWFKRIRS
jgi:capsular exopolysaccharide synthesis family protein